MSARRETPAEKAARVAQRRQAAAAASAVEVDPAPVARRPAQEQVPVKNVRITLDLAPALYDSFGDWNRRAARELGRGRITAAETLRVLLHQLLDDEELSATVLRELRNRL